MKILKTIMFTVIFLSITIMSAQESKRTYNNPVINTNTPDPSVIKDPEGVYYVYSTASNMNLPIYKSNDLVNWEFCNYAFSDSEKPTQLKGGNLWAPDVIHYKGKYLMAYSLSKWGENKENGIGLAIADVPTGPFKNLGLLFTSDEIGVRNSIDPSLIVDKDKLYLLWGSFNGLYIVELVDTDGLITVKDPDDKIKIAGNAFEGSHIFKHGKYYYLFASVGRCCAGEKSTYRVVVGRSKKLFGPYVDESDVNMIENGYNLVFGGNEKFVGPGHGSSIITDKDNDTWYIYHAYERSDVKKGRQLMLDKILWSKDGWPYMHRGEPSISETIAPKL